MEDTPKRKKKWAVAAIAAFTALFVFVVAVMLANSVKPNPLAIGETKSSSEGSAFIRTNQALIEQFSANWLPNDIFWPTVFLDNMPNFQLGQLEVVRYNIRVLRDNLSRMRTTDKLDKSAEAAFTALANDPHKWWFPSAESKWELALDNLRVFGENLERGDSHFYPRADNLIDLLSQYASLMGGINTRLINAPGDVKTVLALNGDSGGKSGGSGVVETDIPWHEIDDNFYYAQGAAYALYESFKAIRIDFIKVLKDKNSLNLVDKVLEDLNRCRFEPLFVMNGDLDSLFSNHSMNLSGVFNDARQKINSLIEALKQG